MPRSGSGRDLDTSRLCEHLRPYLDALLEGGARVQEVNVDAWSKCAFQVICDRGPGHAEAERELRLPAGIELWKNTDPHYGMNTGLFCHACTHALEWPSEGGLPIADFGLRISD